MADLEAMLRQLSNENTAKTFDFNSKEAQKERDWSKMMSDTSHQREVDDLKRAGINPVLSANGGASAYSASSASGTADNSAVGVLASIYETKLNNKNAAKISAQTNKANLKQTKINAAAQKYASDQAYAAARLQYEASLYGTDKSKYGMIDNFIAGVTGTSSTKSKSPSAKKIGNKVQNNVVSSFKNIFKNKNTPYKQTLVNRKKK